MAITLDINGLVQHEFLNVVDPDLEPHLQRSFWVRNTTLDCCYSIREYEFLPNDVRDDVYDVIKGLVEELATAYRLGYGQIDSLRKSNHKEV